MWRILFLFAVLTLTGCQTWTSGMTLPSPRYLESPPQYFPSSPPPELPTEKPLASPAFPPASEQPVVIVNVHKEPVQVFKVEKGELTFLLKVPPGEAIDLSVVAGTKLSATFSSAPHCVNYTVKMTTEQVWLLRPAPAEKHALYPDIPLPGFSR